MNSEQGTVSRGSRGRWRHRCFLFTAHYSRFTIHPFQISATGAVRSPSQTVQTLAGTPLLGRAGANANFVSKATTSVPWNVQRRWQEGQQYHWV